MSESRFGTHRPATATAMETPIDEIIGGTTLPDLDPEQLHDPEPQRVTSSTRYVDIVGPLHGMFFDDEETVTEEQFAWTLLGILLSAAVGQCRKITAVVIRLLMLAYPRSRSALRHVLGLARIFEDAVQEVETEMPTMQEHENPVNVPPEVTERSELVETQFHDGASHDASPSPEASRRTTPLTEHRLDRPDLADASTTPRSLVDVWCSACQQKMNRHGQTSVNWKKYICSSYPYCSGPLLRPFGQPHPS